MNFSTISKVSFIALCLSANSAYSITLPVLDSTQIDPLMDSFAAALVFRSLEAPSHPRTLGLWFNVRANVSTSTALTSTFGTSQAMVPFAAIQAGVNGPFQLGLEFGMLPSITISGITGSNYGGDIKWSYLKFFLPNSPVDSAVRLIYTVSSLVGTETLSGISGTASYGSSVYGLSVDVGKNLRFFEPYAGIGFLAQSSSLSASGSTSIFGSSFAVNTNTVSSSTGSLWFRAGIELRFLVTIGIQDDYAFNTNTISTKFGFRF